MRQTPFPRFLSDNGQSGLVHKGRGLDLPKSIQSVAVAADMTAGDKFTSPIVLAAMALSLGACTNGPKDIRVISVTDTDFRAETELEWARKRGRVHFLDDEKRT